MGYQPSQQHSHHHLFSTRPTSPITQTTSAKQPTSWVTGCSTGTCPCSSSGTCNCGSSCNCASCPVSSLSIPFNESTDLFFRRNKELSLRIVDGECIEEFRRCE